MFLWRNKKIVFLVTPVIWSYVNVNEYLNEMLSVFAFMLLGFSSVMRGTS